MRTGLPYPFPTSAAASAIARGNRPRDTLPEVRLRSHLHRAGFRFRKDLLVHIPGRRRGVRPDIAFPSRRLVVFIDGCFWHGCPEHGHVPMTNAAYWGPKLARNVQRDRAIDDGLRKAGWRVLRIWEHTPVRNAAEGVAAALASGS